MQKKPDLIEFVQNMSISFPKYAYQDLRESFRGSDNDGSLILKSGEEQTVISDKSLISFVSQVSAENRADILESTLLAQLGAKAKVTDDNDVIGWYKSYIDILSHLGWTVEGGEVEKFKSNGSVLELEGVIIDILTTAFGASFVKIIKNVLDGIKKLGDGNGKITAFESNTHYSRNGSFQLGVATQANGAVSFNIGTFLITTEEKIKHILFVKFKNESTELKYAASKLTLDQNIYAVIRAEVKAKLSVNSLKYVAELPTV